jgi:hypothetical protein
MEEGRRLREMYLQQHRPWRFACKVDHESSLLVLRIFGACITNALLVAVSCIPTLLLQGKGGLARGQYDH